MNEIQVIPPAIQGFDYAILGEDLATKCQAAAVRIKGRFRTIILEIVEIGRDLIAIQEKMPHGAWGPWLEAEFGFTDRTARYYMNTARFMEGKSEAVSLLPPATLYALAAPSNDPGVVAELLDEVIAGRKPAAADVKARLAKAKAAQRKAQATQKKSPEQLKKEQASEKRRQALLEKLDREHRERWGAVETAREEAAKEIARRLVAGLGAGGALALVALMRDAGGLYRVEELFLHPPVDGKRTLLTEAEIEEKFGGAE